tara:strand:+ start:36573 stop:37688 length:1116 start_codon:yes stop_codon:yes gene_type:complete
MKVLHIITSLGSGGTEGMLYRLIQASSKSVEHSVICLKKGGKYESLFKKDGLDLIVIDLKFSSLIKGIIQIYKFSLSKRKQGYQIITSWLYHADFVAWFVKLICRYKFLAWNIRSSKLQRRRLSFKNWLNFKILAMLSHFGVNKIISCSKATLEIHKKIGYRDDIFTFIPNGYFIDQNKYFNKEFKNYDGIYRICMVARWHPQKDFENLFKALSLLKSNISFHLKIAGSETGPDNQEIVNLLKKYKIEKFCTLMGEVDDVQTVYQKSHVNVLSSAFGETFPNVLSESMLNFTPCVSTDVGDANNILADVGFIVPVGNSKALADALKENHSILKDQNDLYLESCVKGFEKVRINYNIYDVARVYYDVWKSLV